MFFMGVINTLQIILRIIRIGIGFNVSMVPSLGLMIETQNFTSIVHLMCMQTSTEVIALSCGGIVP